MVRFIQVSRLGAASANADAVSTQNVSGALAQKSSSLVGPVVTSNFTTTSASLVDVTGMTITLAATNSVTTVLRALAVFNVGGGTPTVTWSLNSTATKEYSWFMGTGAGVDASPSRNADMSAAMAALGSVTVELVGFLTGTTSGVVTKIQAAVSALQTLTVFIGSAIWGSF